MYFSSKYFEIEKVRNIFKDFFKSVCNILFKQKLSLGHCDPLCLIITVRL